MIAAKNVRKMIVLTAPSGAGKTTIVRHLLAQHKLLEFSVSATTRLKRDNEVDGKDYYFLSQESFQNKIAEHQFAEWEEVYQNQFYGTLKCEINRIWEKGHAIVFDIDVQGALSIKEQYGDDCLTIFVKAPSINVLEERLKSRKSESDESFQKRIVKAKKEMAFENKFDVVIVNDLLDVALKEADYLVKNFIYNFPYLVFESQ